MTDSFKSSFKFCSSCGGALTVTSERPVRLQCSNCRRIVYLNPKVGVAVLIEFDGKVLLAQRSEEPLKGWWTLPAGYVEYEESCEETARREADEELSTRIVLGSLFGVYSYGDDPRSRMVLVVYRATCDVSTIRAGDDISATCFFAPDQIPSDVAFQGNKDALSDWIQARQSFGAPQS